MFDKLSEYKAKEQILTEEQKAELQYQIAESFGSIDRGQQLINILGTNEDLPVTLKEKFEVAARISKEIDDKYLSRIDCTDFNKGLEEAGKVMDEILSDDTLNEAQKQAALMGIMTHMITTTNLHQHGKGSTPKEVTLALARKKGLPESTIADIEAAYAQADK
jgi:superoxide dismutase